MRTINGITYKLSKKQWIVVGYDLPAFLSDKIQIESYIDQKPVVAIQAYAFTGCPISIKEIIIPNTISKIGQEAFKDCCWIRSITILQKQNSVLEIGDLAFANCSELLNFDVQDDFGVFGTVSLSGVGIFQNCKNLKAMNCFFSGIIPKATFRNCFSVKRLMFCGITSFSDANLQHCHDLESVVFLGKVVKLKIMDLHTLMNKTIFCHPLSNLCELSYNGFNIRTGVKDL